MTIGNENNVTIPKSEIPVKGPVYQPPVSQLLSLGDQDLIGASLPYGKIGLGREHIPELIRMATDDRFFALSSHCEAFWAPAHAWRALGELRAEEAIAPLLGLLQRDDDEMNDWLRAELPPVLAAIGPAVLPPLLACLTDPSHPDWAREIVADSVGLLCTSQPAMREECIARVSAQLERFAQQAPILNGALIATLVDLKAVESSGIMERAFAAGAVDEVFAEGDWKEVQVDLRLLPADNSFRMPSRFCPLGDTIRRLNRKADFPGEPVFVGDVEARTGVLCFRTGERAGQSWTVPLECCPNPMCGCWSVTFECWPEGTGEGAHPLRFALDAKKETLARCDGALATGKAKALAEAVRAEFRAGDWDRLAQYCIAEKQAGIEAMNYTKLDGKFPLDLVDPDVEVISYDNVFPFAKSFVFELNGAKWVVTDGYCVDPECSCDEVLLDFLPVRDLDGVEGVPEIEIPVARYNYLHGKIEAVAPIYPASPSVETLWAALTEEHPDFEDDVMHRHMQLRYLYKQALGDSVTRSLPYERPAAKIGRNDPCPCGSGKKYKKCCGK